MGVSLFLLGLEIMFPSSTHFSIKSLFESSHLPLLAASAGPAILLSISIRAEPLLKFHTKFTQHALYIPLFCILVGAFFWAVATIRGTTNIEKLASAGWLFAASTQREQSMAGQDWNYWVMFNFSLTEWQAITSALSHIALLVVVGALSLPVVVSLVAEEVATQLEKDSGAQSMLSFDLNREFLIHGLSNLASGIAGAVPNMVAS